MIVVCGEALIDMIPGKGGSARIRRRPEASGTPIVTRAGAADEYVPTPGGSPFNLAIGLARLGTPVSFLSRLSRDRYGELLLNRLLAEGVDARFLQRGPEPTTVAFVLDKPGREPQFRFSEQGADRNLTSADIPQAFPPEVLGIHFGSISLVLEPVASTLEACMAREKGRRLISLDPNVRPALIPDRAEYRRRLEGWLHFTDLAKVSRADLGWLYPRQQPELVARRWLELGPAFVVVTCGADGCSGLTRSRTVNVPALRMEVKDTVGAGDSFTAGLLAWLYQRRALAPRLLAALSDQELGAALGYAAAAAALTCGRAGADPPDAVEVEAALGLRARDSTLDS
ncbi:MAG TPA: carbohydrate kinase [Candidatus Dormibacteraeota bacterium]|nr:carbohydrate kinase [Candidatus Dormibacteraeota bacterium]